MNRLSPLFLTLTVSLSLLGASPLAQAQTEKYRFPTEAASWTVTCDSRGSAEASTEAPPADAANASNPDAEAPANEGRPAVLRVIEISQTKEHRRTIMRWSNGQKREMWSMTGSGLIVTEDPRGKTFVTANSGMFGDPFSPLNFEWMKSAALVTTEPVMYRGVSCFHYKGGIVEVNPHDNTTKTIPCQAWIDAATQLPVAFLKGDILGRFSFGVAPAELVMPDKFQKRLDYYKITMGIPLEKKP